MLVSLNFSVSAGIVKPSFGEVTDWGFTAEDINVDNNRYKMMDKIVIEGLVRLPNIFLTLEDYALTLITLFCFLNIIFHCFKLWFGTMELKKVFVDVIYKCMMCIMILNFYPAVQRGTIQAATYIGMTAAGGQEKITYAFINTFNKLKDQLDSSGNALFAALIEYGTYKGSDGKTYITENDLEAVRQNTALTEEKINEWLELADLKVSRTTTENKRRKYGRTAKNSFSYVDDNGNVLKGSSVTVTTTYGGLKNLSKSQYSSTSTSNFVNSNPNVGLLAGYSQIAYKKILAMTKTLMGEDAYEIAMSELGEGKDAGDVVEYLTDRLESLFYNPFLYDHDGNLTFWLSPSYLMKTNLLISEMITSSSQQADVPMEVGDTLTDWAERYERIEEEKEEEVPFMEDGNFFWAGFKRLLFSLLYFIGPLICTIIAISEYIMCLYEYIIVTSTAILLIPLLFLDATKSYAQNIIKIFLQYFAKMMMVNIAIFFALGLFLDAGINTFMSSSMNTVTALGYYLLVLMFGVTFILSSEKIANILFTGTPQMSTGDIVHAVHEGTHAAQALGKVGGAGVKAVQNLGKGGQAMVRGGQGIAAMLSGSKAASDEAKEQMAHALDAGGNKSHSIDTIKNTKNPEERKKLQQERDQMINAAGKKAGFSVAGDFLKQKAGDGLHKLLSGKEANHNDGENTGGFLKTGQDYMKDGRNMNNAGFRQMKQQAQELGRSSDRIGKAVEKAQNGIFHPTKASSGSEK